MRRIRGKLADHVGDHIVLSPEGALSVTSPGTKWSYPRPPQSLIPLLIQYIGEIASKCEGGEEAAKTKKVLHGIYLGFHNVWHYIGEKPTFIIRSTS